MRIVWMGAVGLVLGLVGLTNASAQSLPTGYFVWTKGDVGAAQTRAIWRMTLPAKTDRVQLTTGEDVEPQISPDGKWVAYAKAKLEDPEGTDYHKFNRWRIYVVSIHGVGDGRVENKIDDNGYWPSWGSDGALYYSQTDENHTNIMRARVDEYGRVIDSQRYFSTRRSFDPEIPLIDEVYVAPDASWFAARTRQSLNPDIPDGVGAYSVSPAKYHFLAQAGNVGCMPVIAPSGTWSLIAGASFGARWGQAPNISGRVKDEELIAAKGGGGLVYFPTIASDENWVVVGHSSDLDQNAGAWSLYIYALNDMAVSNEQVLVDSAEDSSYNGWSSLWVGTPTDPPPPIPYIDWFHPSSYTIVAGASVDLEWETSFADEVTLEGAPVSLDGTSSVSPAATTTYRLEARHTLNATDTSTSDVTVTVHATAQPVSIDSFELDVGRITAGESAVLSWSVTNPTTLDINGERIAPSGSMTVEPLTQTTYVLTAGGHPSAVTAEVTLEVDELQDIELALLPDRGGCMCGASATGSRGTWAWLLVLFVVRRRRRRA